MKKAFKKVLCHVFLFSLLVCSVIFSACNRQSVTFNNITFTYEKNSAQKISYEGQDYVKLKLELKNKSGNEAEIKAQSFVLKEDNSPVSEAVYFGNNIIDKMGEEKLEGMGSVNLILNFAIGEAGKELAVYYEDNLIAQVRI